MASYCIPDWPAPARVAAVVTTRRGGCSTGAYRSFNLADHVGDDPAAVGHNRAKLASDWGLPQPLPWLRQVHGTAVADLDSPAAEALVADAAVTGSTGVPCVVLTADCLPVLLCDRAGSRVAAAHAGWRGLAAGVLRHTVAAMGIEGDQILAWLGPAIGPGAFEVGPEVRDSFAAQAIDARHARALLNCFAAGVGAGKLLADLYGLARLELAALGVNAVYGGDFCTHGDSERFYSYRRDGETGRMASLVWLR